jgi:hypothetical protein
MSKQRTLFGFLTARKKGERIVGNRNYNQFRKVSVSTRQKEADITRRPAIVTELYRGFR